MEIIKLTTKAQTKATELLEAEKKQKPDAIHAGLRIAVVGGGCSGLSYQISFANPEEDDFVHQYNEQLVVLVDPKSAPFLTGARLEYHEDLQRSGFEVVNPQSKNSCGCGKSFSV